MHILALATSPQPLYDHPFRRLGTLTSSLTYAQRTRYAPRTSVYDECTRAVFLTYKYLTRPLTFLAHFSLLSHIYSPFSIPRPPRHPGLIPHPQRRSEAPRFPRISPLSSRSAAWEKACFLWIVTLSKWVHNLLSFHVFSYFRGGYKCNKRKTQRFIHIQIHHLHFINVKQLRYQRINYIQS